MAESIFGRGPGRDSPSAVAARARFDPEQPISGVGISSRDRARLRAQDYTVSTPEAQRTPTAAQQREYDRAPTVDDSAPAAASGRRFSAPSLPSLPSIEPSKAQRVLFITWGVAVGLRFMKDVIVDKDWPCPGRYFKISALYLLLALTSEAAPAVSMWLGVGFLVAFAAREANQEIATKGTWFGVKVGQPA